MISTAFFSRLIKVWRQQTRIRRWAIIMVTSSTTTTMVMMTMMTMTTWIRTVTTKISVHVWFVPCRSARHRFSSRETHPRKYCAIWSLFCWFLLLFLSLDCFLVFLFDNVDVHDQTDRFLPFIFVYLFVLSLYDISIKKKARHLRKTSSRARAHTLLSLYVCSYFSSSLSFLHHDKQHAFLSLLFFSCRLWFTRQCQTNKHFLLLLFSSFLLWVKIENVWCEPISSNFDPSLVVISLDRE